MSTSRILVPSANALTRKRRNRLTVLPQRIVVSDREGAVAWFGNEPLLRYPSLALLMEHLDLLPEELEGS